MALGIDIGSKSIKMVEIKMEAGKPTLKAVAAVGLKDVGIERLTSDVEFTNLAGIIKKLAQNAKISTKDVNIALPEAQVFIRNLNFPLLTDAEIASAVKWQAEEIIPIPVKDAIFQHVILERKENAQPPSVSVLVVAAPRTLIEKYVKLFTLAGFNVTGVETELIALSRSLGAVGQTLVLINFGSKSADIAVAKNAKLVFSRTIPTAGDAFTRAVSQNMGIPTDQAEEYKKTYGLSSTQLEGKVANAIMPIFKIVAEEIKKSIHFYETSEKGETPNLILLSGGTAGLPDIAPNLTKLIGIEVAIANPFSKVYVNPNMAKNLQSVASLYSTAVGLALKEG